MIVYFIQVKMSKGRRTLTMNLIAHIMTYETKERCLSLIIKKVRYISLTRNNKQNNKTKKKTYKNNKNPLA